MISTWCFLFSGLLRVFVRRRDAALAACVAFGLIVVLITESLSAATLFYFQPMLCAWIAAAVLSAIFNWVICRFKKDPAPRQRLSFSDPIILGCGLCIALILVMVGLTAVISPPNNWDAMTYHMARVANWVQHRTVAFYPTPILRQLYLGPFAEYAIAHLQILTGSDRLANLVQFAAMIGNVLGVTAVAGKLSASPRGQAVSGLFAATIPMLILQASNTQTDCVAALWVVCAFNAGFSLIKPTPAVRYAEEPGRSRDQLSLTVSLFFAASIGLAFLTKATTAFVLAPFVLWILLARFKSTDLASTAKLFTLTCALPLLINAPQFYRNHATFGRFLTPEAEAGWYQNSIHTPGAIVSSLARNILSNTGFRGMHGYPTHAAGLVKVISGLDPSDPRITYSGQKFLIKYTRDEHDAGNPVHLLLGAICVAAAVWNFRRHRAAAVYACCILCGFFLFSFELKWQPWITRLQLPIFVIVAPLCGLLIDPPRGRTLAVFLCAVLFAQSLIYLIYGFPRPLRGSRNIFSTPRADLYFNKRPDLQQPYQQAARLIARSHPAAIALACKGDSWEYAIRSQLPRGTAIFHVGVENQSSTCPSLKQPSQPEFLVQLEAAAIPAEYAAYQEIYTVKGIAVWQRRPETH